MRDPVSKIIDGQTYVFHQLPVRKSMRLLSRIVKIVGPGLGAAAGGGKNLGALLDAELDLEAVLRALCDRLDEDAVEAIVDDLLSQARHKGQGELTNPQAFEALFGGNLPHLLRVTAAAFEAEYGNFFGGKLATAVFQAGAGTTQARPTSTG